MIKIVSVDFSPQARATMLTLNNREMQRLNNIIKVIKNAPEDGHFYAPPASGGEGGAIRQMTGGTMHVIYRVKMISIGSILQIVFIEIRDWDMDDAGTPYGIRRKEGVEAINVN